MICAFDFYEIGECGEVNQDNEVINGLMYSLRQTLFQYERKRKRSLEKKERIKKEKRFKLVFRRIAHMYQSW